MRTLPVIALLSLSLGLACAGDEEVTPTPPPPPPKAKVKVKASLGFNDVKFTCCNNGNADTMLQEYLDTQARLADNEKPAGDFTALYAATRKASNDGSLTPDARAAAAAMMPLVDAAKSGEIEDMRAQYDAIGKQMRILTNATKGSGNHTVAWVYCPMDKGGHWMQTAGAVDNPYYGAGSGMVDCGSFQE